MDLAKTEGIKVLVESVKLYVTIAGFFLAGLIAYLSNDTSAWESWWFRVSILSVLLCCIASILNLGLFVNRCFQNELVIHDATAKAIHWCVIVFFALGISGTVVFLARRSPVPPASSKAGTSGVQITKDQILIGDNVSTQVFIQRDTNGVISQIQINAPNQPQVVRANSP